MKFTFIIVVVIVGGILAELLLIMRKKRDIKKSYGESLFDGTSCNTKISNGTRSYNFVGTTRLPLPYTWGSLATKSAYLHLVQVVTWTHTFLPIILSLLYFYFVKESNYGLGWSKCFIFSSSFIFLVIVMDIEGFVGVFYFLGVKAHEEMARERLR